MRKPVSRRAFLKGMGSTAVGSAALSAAALAQTSDSPGEDPVQGPEPVPVTLKVNGKEHTLSLEPRVTLLDALRDHLSITGSKSGCDRGGCGACTVLLDGRPVNACMILAIAVQGRAVTTVEGISKDGKLTPLQKAFVEEDGLQCGYCTPGFIMSLTPLAGRKVRWTEEDVRLACSGNLCRCGSYPHAIEAALRATGASRSKSANVHSENHGKLA